MCKPLLCLVHQKSIHCHTGWNNLAHQNKNTLKYTGFQTRSYQGVRGQGTIGHWLFKTERILVGPGQGRPSAGSGGSADWACLGLVARPDRVRLGCQLGAASSAGCLSWLALAGPGLAGCQEHPSVGGGSGGGPSDNRRGRHKNQGLLGSAGVCWGSSGVCRSLLESAGACRGLPGSAGVCWESKSGIWWWECMIMAQTIQIAGLRYLGLGTQASDARSRHTGCWQLGKAIYLGLGTEA